MKIKKLIIIPVLAIFFLAGCANEETGQKKESIANPVTNPVGHTQDMVNLKNNMQKNIQDATNKENQLRQEALNNLDNNEKNMANSPKGLTDNTSLVKQYPLAVIKTSLGDIKVKLAGDSAPIAAGNFLKLAKDGFYDNTKFHRVIKNFMIQGGDPLSKDESKKNMWGTGGPGYDFKDELSGQEKYTQGTLAMANAGPNTNGSQFFIITADSGYPLPPSYTVFGQVVSGMDVALKIQNVQVSDNTDVPANCPLQNVIIKNILPLEK